MWETHTRPGLANKSCSTSHSLLFSSTMAHGLTCFRSSSAGCAAPFWNFFTSFSLMVLKIQSSLPESSPPDAWPSGSLQWHRFQKMTVVLGVARFCIRLWTCHVSPPPTHPSEAHGDGADNLLIRFIRAGFIPRLLWFPPLVSVNQLCQIGCLFGMPYNILMF